MQLRYLATMQEFTGDKTSTVVLPLPMDAFQSFLRGSVADANTDKT